MTLGEIIKEYLQDHTLNEFLSDSGISKAYTYNLINNKGTNGAAPTPTIGTINKVAKGIHSDFDTVFSKLDPDIVISAKKKPINFPRTYIKQRHTDFNLFNIIEYSEGNISLHLKEPYQNYLPFLENEIIQKLLDATVGRTDEQIEVAIGMLNAFQK